MFPVLRGMAELFFFFFCSYVCVCVELLGKGENDIVFFVSCSFGFVLSCLWWPRRLVSFVFLCLFWFRWLFGGGVESVDWAMLLFLRRNGD